MIEFDIINVPMDGNCFYHALVKYLELTKGKHIDHFILRQEICNFMIRKSKTISNNLKAIDFPMSDEDIIDIAKLHSHRGVFTDHELIQRVAMKILDIPIRIYFGSGMSTCWNPARKPINECCNLLCQDSHFQLLVVDNVT